MVAQIIVDVIIFVLQKELIKFVVPVEVIILF